MWVVKILSFVLVCFVLVENSLAERNVTCNGNDAKCYKDVCVFLNNVLNLKFKVGFCDRKGGTNKAIREFTEEVVTKHKCTTGGCTLGKKEIVCPSDPSALLSDRRITRILNNNLLDKYNRKSDFTMFLGQKEYFLAIICDRDDPGKMFDDILPLKMCDPTAIPRPSAVDGQNATEITRAAAENRLLCHRETTCLFNSEGGHLCYPNQIANCGIKTQELQKQNANINGTTTARVKIYNDKCKLIPHMGEATLVPVTTTAPDSSDNYNYDDYENIDESLEFNTPQASVTIPQAPVPTTQAPVPTTQAPVPSTQNQDPVTSEENYYDVSEEHE